MAILLNRVVFVYSLSTHVIQAVTTRGGRFLEAPVIGSRQPAMGGQLLIMAAGDRTLFDDCYSCLEAMGRQTFFLGTYHSLTIVY